MADYKRYISYLYRYEDSICGDNVGFVKLEAKASEVKLNVNIKCHDINESELKIGVLYNRDVLEVNNDSNVINEDIAVINVARVMCNETTYSTTYRTDMTNVFDSGVSVERIIGVIIQTNTNKKFISKWNDTEINVERIMDNHIIGEDVKCCSNENNDNIEEDVILNLNDFNESRIIRDDNYNNDEKKKTYNENKKESLAKKIFRHYPC